MEPHDERSRRTRLISAPYMMHVSLNSWNAYRARTRLTGTGDNNGRKSEEVARLVETLALGSVAKNTHKKLLSEVEYLGETEKIAR